MSNVLLVFICVIGGFGIGALLTMFKLKTVRNRAVFNAKWENGELRGKLNKFENALVLIRRDELLKREIIALAEKTLREVGK